MVVLLLASITGCSLASPFVTRAIPPPAPLAPLPSPSPDVVSLAQAFDYAGRVKKAYRDALQDQAQLQSWLALGLVPLTAAAMGLGARGASPDAVLALGLTGASAFGLGTFFSNKPRQLAWVAGIKAVTCAETALVPLNVPLGTVQRLTNDLTSLRAALTDLERKMAALETLVDRSKALRLSIKSDKPEITGPLRALESLETSAGAEVSEINAVIRGAEEALKTGENLRLVFDTAGWRLVQAVNNITDEVDALVVETQRDPQALATIIAGLGATYRMVTTVPEGMAPQSAKEAAKTQPASVKHGGKEPNAAALDTFEKQQLVAIGAMSNELATGLDGTRQAAAAVQTSRRAVSDLVNGIIKETPVESLKGCGVKAGDLVTSLAIDPPGPLEILKPGTATFTIKGGLSPYGAGVSGGVTGLVVTQSPPFSPVVTVSATGDTPDGQYAVAISDGSSQTKTVTVKVKKATDKGPKDALPGSAVTDAVTQLAKSLDEKKPTVTVNDGVMVTVTGATLTKEQDPRVVVVLGPPTVAPNSNTIGVAAAVRNRLWQDYGKPLDVSEDKIAFQNQEVLARDSLDRRKVGTCLDAPAKGPVFPDPEFSKLSETNRETLQRALGLTGADIDGRWGPKTKGKVILYQCQSGATKDPQTGTLTKELVSKLLDTQ